MHAMLDEVVVEKRILEWISKRERDTKNGLLPWSFVIAFGTVLYVNENTVHVINIYQHRSSV